MLYVALVESFGFQGRHWYPGDEAAVTKEELSHPALAPEVGQFAKAGTLPLAEEPADLRDLQAENTFSGIAKAAAKRPQTGILAKKKAEDLDPNP